MSIDAFPPSMTTTTDDATLEAIADLSTSANTIHYYTGVDTAALTPLTPFMRTLLDDPDLATAQATLGITGGGGGGAPTDAEYIVGSANGTLTQERVLTTTPTVAWDLTTAGQAKANVPDASITEAKLSLSDVTTQNVSTTAHGLTPKLSGVATQYLDGTGLWTVPPAGTTYTDEQAQDAVGAMLLDTATIDLTYGDGGPTLQADVKDLSITEAKLTFVDVTTKDASTTTHGLLRKLSGTATQYLDGSGAWTTPAGGGDTLWTRNAGTVMSLATGLLAFWRMEEGSGNRVDSVSGMALVPQGTVGTITNAAGKQGNALAMNGTSGAYLSIADNPALSVGTNQSFTIACWVYVNVAAGTSMAFISKGAGVGSYGGLEYMLWMFSGDLRLTIGNGAGSFTHVISSTAAVAAQWCLLIGWYDAVADIQYIQVNNGTPNQAANALGSHDSVSPVEVGRKAGESAYYLNGRLDMPCFWRRVLTTQERSDLWSGGNGVDYATIVGTAPWIRPTTSTDLVVAGATVATATEPLESAGGIKLGTTTGTTDGTLRWSGTDFEGRKAGAWVSMTGAGAASASTGMPPFLLMGA